ncbi:MAG TPA: protein translocase SEC61 complex subunit gamma [Methanosarcinaceae archaeon]|nr:protein translocase SEC61 complex subunit gamma [Methanosarcinaceae archaeon]
MVESTFNLSNLKNINVSKTLKSYLRVLKLTKKPSREEFLMIAKVAGAGIILIGFIGFIIYVLLTEVPKWM